MRVNIKGLMFLIFLIILMLFIFRDFSLNQSQLLVTITFLLNGFLIIVFLFRKSKFGFSMFDIFNLFMFIFMFIAPLFQYLNNYFPWWDSEQITNDIVVKTNIVIFLFLILYYLSYFHSFRKKTIIKKRKISESTYISSFILEFSFLLSILSSIYIIWLIGIPNIFFRSTGIIDISNSSLVLLINYGIRAIPLIAFLLHLKFYKERKQIFKNVHLYIMFCLVLITHFPTGLPRFIISASYIAIIIIIIGTFKNKYIFKYIIIIGMIVLFQLLNFFRTNDFSNISNIKLSIDFSKQFLSGDYDAFSMLSRAIIFVSREGTTMGNQLLTSLLFFIPRFWWESKSIGSGMFIGKYFDWPFLNVSMPFIGEAYLNFGIIGVIGFSITLGLFSSYLDKRFINVYKNNESVFFTIMYLMLIGLLFFILRGDLLSSLSYTLGYFTIIYIFYVINKIYIRIR